MTTLTQVLLRRAEGAVTYEVVGFVDRVSVYATGEDGRRWEVVKTYASMRADFMNAAKVLRFTEAKETLCRSGQSGAT